MALRFEPGTIRIEIIDMGYVGAPLAVEFASEYPAVGLDAKLSRIEELRRGEDSTREVEAADLNEVCLAPGTPRA